MAVNVQRYALLYEKYKGMGLGEEEAQQRATKEASISEEWIGKKMAKQKKKKESRIKRLARLMKMAALGKHYKSDWQRKQEIRGFKTVRTKAITKRLKAVGLTEKEIARLR